MARMVEEYVKHTYRYFYEDGLVEIAVGLLMVVVGAALFSWQYVASSLFRVMILVVILPASIIGGMFLVRRFVHKAKERVTYVRTGYVSFREGEPTGSRLFPLLSALVLLVAVFFLPEVFSRLQFAIGYFLVVFLSYLGFRLGVRRFYGVGILAFLMGIASTIIFASEIEGAGLTITGAGVFILLSGVLTFFHYLRQHPEPGNEQA
ncbi:MAG: hypothetical protein IPM39_19810 [Chloroflexi bacterium]|nr:hypothetical protein [Chloroflexota bacterium]